MFPVSLPPRLMTYAAHTTFTRFNHDILIHIHTYETDVQVPRDSIEPSRARDEHWTNISHVMDEQWTNISHVMDEHWTNISHVMDEQWTNISHVMDEQWTNNLYEPGNRHYCLHIYYHP